MKKIILFFMLAILAQPTHANLTDEDESAIQLFVNDLPQGIFVQEGNTALMLRRLRRGELKLVSVAGPRDEREKAVIKTYLKNIASFNFLKKLILVRLGLDELPPAALSLPNLTHLDLRVNNIKTLPQEIRTLNKLTKLILTQNPIQTFTDDGFYDGNRTRLWGVADIRNHFKRMDRLEIDEPDDAPVGITTAASAANVVGGSAAAAAQTIEADDHHRVQEELSANIAAYGRVTRRLHDALRENAQLRAENAELRRRLTDAGVTSP